MKSKHTEGPWIYNKLGCRIESTTVWYEEATQDEDAIPVQVVSLRGAMGGDDVEADANLIAAAPELLETLKRIHDLTLPYFCKLGVKKAFTELNELAAANKLIHRLTQGEDELTQGEVSL